ncbi:MAG: hypothetical protein LBE31_09775 [Deltaproteobacteria bacterium]|nr:hypothetical protein [Deltaproteobacteria bacterium]
MPTPSANHASPAPSGAQILCPVCGIMVKLPAVECPKCRANLRTGEKPEEYVPLWKRKKTKALVLLAIIMTPPLIFGLLTTETGMEMRDWLEARVGLESCVEPQKRWEDFSQKDLEDQVKKGYDNWSKGKNTRIAGQSAKGPETPEELARSDSERTIDRDNQAYFASALMSSGPRKTLRPQDNWYLLMDGEWEVAYIINPGSSDSRIIGGEWSFTWINNGQAVQDVLAVPFQWNKTEEQFEPILITSIRLFNPQRNSWEGFHVMNGVMVYFGVTKTAQNQILEHYQTGDGRLIVWVYSDLNPSSFKVTISQSTDNGATYKAISEMWAKRRDTVIP